MQRTENRVAVAVRVYEEISRSGGRTAKEVATALNLPLRYITEALVALEGDGLMLCEDDEGRLTVYKKEKL